ncbi:hypothetical protein DNTS_004544 [Danionella cerebrum]|uniref:Uncharacterized protein n=1 Tax=Danionella cerebrum TaxID=2873325 RepID=A0A553RKL7_9TELE|nr:hypothetical protein DNTS_004544 [Danionella translucida]
MTSPGPLIKMLTSLVRGKDGLAINHVTIETQLRNCCIPNMTSRSVPPCTEQRSMANDLMNRTIQKHHGGRKEETMCIWLVPLIVEALGALHRISKRANESGLSCLIPRFMNRDESQGMDSLVKHKFPLKADQYSSSQHVSLSLHPSFVQKY